jgi:hypothetical protein
MVVEFSGDVYFWKGPAPWYFVKVPEEASREIRDIVSMVSYGWGMIPVHARIGATEWTTSLWPKDGHYILPIKAVVRRAEHLEEGDTVVAHLTVVGSGRG